MIITRTLGGKQIIFLPMENDLIFSVIVDYTTLILFSIDSFFSTEIFEKFHRIGIKFKQ